MKYRKKPVVIEAQQWFPGVAIDGVITDPLALVGKSWAHIGHQRELDGSMGIIETLEGPHFVRPGDWIITGVAGEKYPCKPDIFAATYEAVE
jgi:hypothetical protein